MLLTDASRMFPYATSKTSKLPKTSRSLSIEMKKINLPFDNLETFRPQNPEIE